MTHRLPADPSRRGVWAIVAVLGLALALRLPDYTESIWIDELYTSNLFCGDTVILLKTLYSDIHPPAYFVFIHFWNAIFGDGEIWLRLPALLSGLASIVLVWRIGVMFASRAVGLMGAFLLAVSPVHIWYSQEGRPYSTNILLLLATVLTFYRLMEGRRSRWWVTGYFFAITGVVFTHYYMAAFPLVFSALVMLRSTPNRRRILIANGAVLVLLAVYIAMKMYVSDVPTSKTYLRGFDLAEAFHLCFGWFSTGYSFPSAVGLPEMYAGHAYTTLGTVCHVAVQILAVAAFVRGVRQLAQSPRPGAPGLDLLGLLLVLPVFLFGLTLIGLDHTYIERSALPALPFFVLVLGAGLTGWQRSSVTRGVLAGTALVSVITLVAFFTRGERWTVYKPNPDWRAAAAFVGRDLDHGSQHETLYSDSTSPTGLTYYDPRIQEVKKFERNDAKVRKLLDTSGRVFGAWIRESIRARLDQFHELMDRTERETRLRVFELSHHDPLDDSAPREFWLLVFGGYPTKRAKGVLADPRIRVLDEGRFRMLRVYRLRRDAN